LVLCRKIVKQIDLMGLDMLFVVGGNGGNAGASALQNLCAAKGVICSIIGIPKSIDNDILLVPSLLLLSSDVA
jgi:6-phosphofructokinase 1